MEGDSLLHKGSKSKKIRYFLYFVDRASRYKFLEITKLTHFFHVFIYLFSLHVSSVTVLKIRRSYCINTLSGMIIIVPDDILIQFDLLMMSVVTLETCRHERNKYTRKVRQFGYFQEFVTVRYIQFKRILSQIQKLYQYIYHARYQNDKCRLLKLFHYILCLIWLLYVPHFYVEALECTCKA